MQNATNTKAATETKAAELSPRAIALAAHDAARFTGATYSGQSKPRNAGIDKPLNLAAAGAISTKQLTERMRRTISELIAGYGNKPFPVTGIDRKQAAIFVKSGFMLGYTDMQSRCTFSAEIHKFNSAGKAPAKAPK